MYLFPISDVHIDHNFDAYFAEDYFEEIFDFLHEYDEVVVCACGDIGTRMQGLFWLLKMVEHFPNIHVVYTPGNHEFYGSSMTVLSYDLAMLGNHLHPRLHILDGEYVFRHTINGVNFIGATLWTDINHNNSHAANVVQREMNDYKAIMNSRGHLISTDNTFNTHCNQRKSMFMLFNRCGREGKMVAMSHHHPILPKEPVTDVVSYAYYSDLSILFNEADYLPEYWFCGHTHQSHVRTEKFPSGEVTFVSNQVGYPHQLQTGFSTACVFEI